MQGKVITRIKGGLGNQLFCYAAARRLALVNGAELAIDDVSGFVRDRQYRRGYSLDNFHIPARKASSLERMEPLERYRRGLVKWISKKQPFAERRYLEQDGVDFDERLLTLKVAGTIYLDGLWQSEDYFKDVEQRIRQDLEIVPPNDAINHRMADQIRTCNAVALHVRWFSSADTSSTYNVSADYYRRAMALIDRKIGSPRYFLFTDDLAATKTLALPKDRVTFVSHNLGDQNSYADLWLMTQCQHFIAANSTFSWWGAWLGGGKEKIVVSPALDIREGKITAWNFLGQIPSRWLRI